MMPKKLRFVLKMVCFLCIFIVLHSCVTTFYINIQSYLHTVRVRMEIREAPVANLYKPEIPSIKTDQCAHHVTVYNEVMVTFRNVTLDPRRADAEAKAGVALDKVMEQKEESEIYKVRPGFLVLPCDDRTLKLNNGILRHLNSHVKTWRDSILPLRQKSVINATKTAATHLKGLTILIERNEYANVFWTVMDLYDTFIEMRYLNYTAHATNIILLDARPRGALDDLWRSFNSVQRMHDIHEIVHIDQLSWRFDRKNSPLLDPDLGKVPLMSEFREFILGSTAKPKSPAVFSRAKNNNSTLCSNLHITIVLRHDYVAHPRNPKGLVSRKIANEAELLRHINTTFPTHTAKGVQLEKLTVQQQLSLLSRTDILFGMHGAALAFSVLMPKPSALVEMFPAYYGRGNWHMAQLARWSGHAYVHARLDGSLDNREEQTTRVPLETVTELLNKAIASVCSERGLR